MQLNKTSAIERLSNLGMDDMPVIEYAPKLCRLAPDWFQKYSSLRQKFLKSLPDSMEEIVFMNLTQEEYVKLIMGQELPDNLSVRFKIPLVWGGDMDISNMFLCYTFPHSYNLDRFIIEQNDARLVYLPNPAKKIYLPSHLGGGGDGGNVASDRLSQIVSSFGRGNE